MEVLLLLALILGVVLGVGLAAWQLSWRRSPKYVWVVDDGEGLSELERQLNHLSDEGFVVDRVFLRPLEGEPPAFVIIGCRSGI